MEGTESQSPTLETSKLYSAVQYSLVFFKEFNSSYSRVGRRLGTGGVAHDIPAPGDAKRLAMERDTSTGFKCGVPA